VTRTPGTQFRKLLLYPPELRGPPFRFTGLRLTMIRDSAGVVNTVGKFEAIQWTASAL
jgi:hypothetical protein